jgi:hypothetical protein
LARGELIAPADLITAKRGGPGRRAEPGCGHETIGEYSKHVDHSLLVLIANKLACLTAVTESAIVLIC